MNIPTDEIREKFNGSNCIAFSSLASLKYLNAQV